jgi:hypothetical protein
MCKPIVYNSDKLEFSISTFVLDGIYGHDLNIKNVKYIYNCFHETDRVDLICMCVVQIVVCVASIQPAHAFFIIFISFFDSFSKSKEIKWGTR